MRLAVLINRLDQTRHIWGLVRRASAERHDVTVLLDYRQRQRGGPKDYNVPRADLVERALGAREDFGLYAFVDEDDFSHALGLLRPDALVSVPDVIPGWRPPASVHYARLQTAWSELMWITDPERWDTVFGWSSAWLDWWTLWHQGEVAGSWRWEDARRLRAGLRPRWRTLAMAQRFVPVGWPAAEWTQDEASRQAGGGRPSVVYLPFPYGAVRRGAWSHGIFGMPWPLGLAAVPFCPAGRAAAWHGDNESAVVQTIRHFCDMNRARFVVSAREKTRLRSYVRRAADEVVEHAGPGQPSLAQLLADADLVVHYCSMAVAEAATLGTPWLCIAPTPRLWPAYAARLEPDAFGAPLPWASLWSWPGLGEVRDPHDVIECYGDFRLVPRRVSADAAAAYRSHVLGGEESASARMLAHLERAVSEGRRVLA